MKALLFHPPTGLFLRQDRCQTPIENKSAMEPPNELGYIAAMIEPLGVECRIQDYPMIDGRQEQYLQDLREFKPNIIILAVTAATFDDDIVFCTYAKELNSDTLAIVKAPYLSSNEAIKLMQRFEDIDIILLKEYEYTAREIVEYLIQGRNLAGIRGIVVRENKNITYSGEREFIQELDALPFPARHLFQNKLYIRPDTAELQATIQTARGCPFECIYCLASTLEGKKVRYRGPDNIVAEINECVNKYGIKNFFLRADTFTLNKEWVIELCKLIINEKLNIKWVCNSRVNTLDEERLYWMKKAGCWLISLGIESGNQHILDNMKKNITLEDSRRAVRLCKKYGIKSYTFYILGMPWDNRNTIKDTIRFAKELNGDFFLFHIAVPFAGTELYKIVKENNLMNSDSLYGCSHFVPSLRTFYLSSKQLKALWRKANWTMYTSPHYILQTISHVHTLTEFIEYFKYGYSKIKGLMLS